MLTQEERADREFGLNDNYHDFKGDGSRESAISYWNPQNRIFRNATNHPFTPMITKLEDPCTSEPISYVGTYGNRTEKDLDPLLKNFGSIDSRFEARIEKIFIYKYPSVRGVPQDLLSVPSANFYIWDNPVPTTDQQIPLYEFKSENGEINKAIKASVAQIYCLTDEQKNQIYADSEISQLVIDPNLDNGYDLINNEDQNLTVRNPITGDTLTIAKNLLPQFIIRFFFPIGPQPKFSYSNDASILHHIGNAFYRFNTDDVYGQIFTVANVGDSANINIQPVDNKNPFGKIFGTVGQSKNLQKQLIEEGKSLFPNTSVEDNKLVYQFQYNILTRDRYIFRYIEQEGSVWSNNPNSMSIYCFNFQIIRKSDNTIIVDQPFFDKTSPTWSADLKNQTFKKGMSMTGPDAPILSQFIKEFSCIVVTIQQQTNPREFIKDRITKIILKKKGQRFLIENVLNQFINNFQGNDWQELLFTLIELCFDLKRCGDYEQINSVSIIKNNNVTNDLKNILFFTGDRVCGDFARFKELNTITLLQKNYFLTRQPYILDPAEMEKEMKIQIINKCIIQLNIINSFYSLLVNNRGIDILQILSFNGKTILQLYDDEIAKSALKPDGTHSDSNLYLNPWTEQGTENIENLQDQIKGSEFYENFKGLNKIITIILEFQKSIFELIFNKGFDIFQRNFLFCQALLAKLEEFLTNNSVNTIPELTPNLQEIQGSTYPYPGTYRQKKLGFYDGILYINFNGVYKSLYDYLLFYNNIYVNIDYFDEFSLDIDNVKDPDFRKNLGLNPNSSIETFKLRVTKTNMNNILSTMLSDNNLNIINQIIQFFSTKRTNILELFYKIYIQTPQPVGVRMSRRVAPQVFINIKDILQYFKTLEGLFKVGNDIIIFEQTNIVDYLDHTTQTLYYNLLTQETIPTTVLRSTLKPPLQANLNKSEEVLADESIFTIDATKDIEEDKRSLSLTQPPQPTTIAPPQVPPSSLIKDSINNKSNKVQKKQRLREERQQQQIVKARNTKRYYTRLQVAKNLIGAYFETRNIHRKIKPNVAESGDSSQAKKQRVPVRTDPVQGGSKNIIQKGGALSDDDWNKIINYFFNEIYPLVFILDQITVDLCPIFNLLNILKICDLNNNFFEYGIDSNAQLTDNIDRYSYYNNLIYKILFELNIIISEFTPSPNVNKQNYFVAITFILRQLDEKRTHLQAIYDEYNNAYNYYTTLLDGMVTNQSPQQPQQLQGYMDTMENIIWGVEENEVDSNNFTVANDENDLIKILKKINDELNMIKKDHLTAYGLLRYMNTNLNYKYKIINEMEEFTCRWNRFICKNFPTVFTTRHPDLDRDLKSISALTWFLNLTKNAVNSNLTLEKSGIECCLKNMKEEEIIDDTNLEDFAENLSETAVEGDDIRRLFRTASEEMVEVVEEEFGDVAPTEIVGCYPINNESELFNIMSEYEWFLSLSQAERAGANQSRSPLYRACGEIYETMKQFQQVKENTEGEIHYDLLKFYALGCIAQIFTIFDGDNISVFPINQNVRNFRTDNPFWDLNNKQNWNNIGDLLKNILVIRSPALLPGAFGGPFTGASFSRTPRGGTKRGVTKKKRNKIIKK